MSVQCPLQGRPGFNPDLYTWFIHTRVLVPVLGDGDDQEPFMPDLCKGCTERLLKEAGVKCGTPEAI